MTIILTFLFISFISFIFYYKKNKNIKEQYKIKVEELEKKLNKIIEEENKKKKEIKENKQKKYNNEISIKWFRDNLPSAIKTNEDAIKFINCLDKINEQLMIGNFQKYLLHSKLEEKKDIIVIIGILNKQFMDYKNSFYKSFDEFVYKNANVLSEDTITKLKIWADNDIDNSIKISNAYLNINMLIQKNI